MMEIRLIKPEEEVDYLKVSASSFIWKFNKEEDTAVEMPVLGCFHEGKLVAGAELFDFKCNYCGNLINVLIISGICTLPEYRGTGCIRKILDEIGRTAAEKDVTAAFLAPFSISYYEKFGFAPLNRTFAVRIPFHKLTHVPRDDRIEPYTGEQFEEICALHNKCAFNENLMTLREDRKHFCEKALENADYTYIHRDTCGEADGYVRFRINRPEELVCEEMFVLNPDALKGIVGFLRGYDSVAKTLLVRKQYQGSAFACFADRISGTSYEYQGGYAGRIYDLKKLLENNSYPEEHGSFSILSLDELEQNQGIFHVEYGGGMVSVTKRSEGDYDLSLTAPAAARLLLAGEGHTAQSAAFIDGVSLKNSAEDFFRAFPHRMTRFTDSLWAV